MEYPTANVIARKADKFKAWLCAAGAEVMPATNEFELIRFRAGDAVSIIYRKQTGATTFTGQAETAWSNFRSGATWRALPKTKIGKSSVQMRAIIERDGDNCFYCCKPVSVGERTVEHLVSRTHQGPNHISNLFLAHNVCNSKAGHLSAVEKIKIHVAAAIKRHEFEVPI